MVNWLYNLNVGTESESMPMDIPENDNAGGHTNEEYDQIEQGSPIHEPPPNHSPCNLFSPAHSTPYFFDIFAGTSTRAAHITHDDMLCKVRARNASDAEHDNLFSLMHRQ